MLNIRKLQEAKATDNQIESAKKIYYDLEKAYALYLFAKPDHIRIYVQDSGYFHISKSGRITSNIEAFYKKKIMEKLTENTLQLISVSPSKPEKEKPKKYK